MTKSVMDNRSMWERMKSMARVGSPEFNQQLNERIPSMAQGLLGFGGTTGKVIPMGGTRAVQQRMQGINVERTKLNEMGRQINTKYSELRDRATAMEAGMRKFREELKGIPKEQYRFKLGKERYEIYQQIEQEYAGIRNTMDELNKTTRTIQGRLAKLYESNRNLMDMASSTPPKQ